MDATYKVIIEVRGIEREGTIETHKVFDHIELNDLTAENHAFVMDSCSETLAVLLQHFVDTLHRPVSDGSTPPSV